MSYKQLKIKFKATSLTEDLNKLNGLPLFANGSINKTQKQPLWLGHCPHRRVRGRSKLIKLILNNNPRPWKTLNKALKNQALKCPLLRLWSKIGTTLAESPSKPTAKLGARFQACINNDNKTKTTSSIVSDLIWGGDPLLLDAARWSVLQISGHF